VLAVDVSPWLRSAAPTSAERRCCHRYGRANNQPQLIPGWPYSVVAALERGRTCPTAVLDAVRLGPADDATAVTANQLRAVVGRLLAAGHWRPGDPDILIVCDAGDDVTRLALVLADLPVELVGRLRPDRVLRLPAPPRRHTPRGDGHPGTAASSPWTTRPPGPSRRPRPRPPATAPRRPAAGTGPRPRLPHRTCWRDHQGELPIIEGTLIRLQVDHPPGDRDPKPVWLWSSATGATAAAVDRWWRCFLRRFDLEHTFRLCKQTLGWTAPKLHTPQAADRWTWLVIACHTQLRLARLLADDLRRPGRSPRPRAASPRPGPPRVPEHPRGDHPPGRCTET
jgi:hypothetical protein